MILKVLGLLVFSRFIGLVVAIVLVQTDPAKLVVAGSGLDFADAGLFGAC